MILDRIFGVAVAGTVAHVVLGSSTVELNLWIVDGTWAVLLAFTYIAVLLAVIIDPDQANAHSAAAVTGVAFWMGRMGGFVDLALNGRSDLWSAVNERGLLMVLVVLWHVRAVRAAVVRANIARLRGEIP